MNFSLLPPIQDGINAAKGVTLANPPPRKKKKKGNKGLITIDRDSLATYSAAFVDA